MALPPGTWPPSGPVQGTHFLYSKKCSLASLSHSIRGLWSFSVWMYLQEAEHG